jgi:hypothetical protein
MSADERRLCDAWLLLDENAVTPVMVMQPGHVLLGKVRSIPVAWSLVCSVCDLQGFPLFLICQNWRHDPRKKAQYVAAYSSLQAVRNGFVLSHRRLSLRLQKKLFLLLARSSTTSHISPPTSMRVLLLSQALLRARWFSSAASLPSSRLPNACPTSTAFPLRHPTPSISRLTQ